MAGNFLNEQCQQLVLNLFDYFSREKDNFGPLRDVMAVRERVSDALKISLPTIRNILQRRRENLPLVKKVERTRRKFKTEDMPEQFKSEVRDVVYGMYAEKKPITLKALQETLRDKHIVDASISTIWKLLQCLGFKYKKDCNRRALCEKTNVVALRVTFLQQYTNNLKSALPLPVVFLDETWIFAKGGNKRSWQDETPKSVKKPNSTSEGKRYMILHAGNLNGFIENCSCVFSAKSKSSDYHDNMDAEKFENWVKEQLVPNLKEPSLIILDNASYHSRLIEKLPTSSWNKKELQNWLSKENILFEPTDLRVTLLNLAKQHKKEKQYVVDELLKAHNHKVLRLPPYHCEFNAIENIWGICKSYYDKHIGRDGYNESNVLAMWKESLSQCDAETWKKTIEHAEKKISDRWLRELKIDEIEPIIIKVNNSSDKDSDSNEDFSDDDPDSGINYFALCK